MPSVAVAFSRGKHGDESRNEDLIVTAPPFFAVVDGATSKTPWTGEKSPGQRVAGIVAATIRSFRADVDARDAVDLITRRIAEQAPPARTERPAASAIVLSTRRDEVWAVGDGWLVCDGVATRFSHEIERRAAAARAALLRAELRSRPPSELLADDPGRAMILPLLRSEGVLANVDDGDPLAFGRLDGTPVPPSLVHVCALPAGWQRVVLASDGYPAMAASLDEAEALLAARIRDDPLMVDEPAATKGVLPGQVSFDDRTWLEIVRG